MTMPPTSHPNEKPSRYAALMAAAVDAIIIIDGRGYIQEFNLAAERLFGYQQSDVIGQNVHMLMPAPYAAEHDHYIGRYNATGEARIIGIGREVQAKRKDGSVFPIELSVGEVREAGSPHFVGIIRDISSRKEAEEALRQREEALRQIIDNAPLGIMTCDRYSRILAINRKLCHTLHYQESDLIGHFLADILHPHDLGLLRTHSDRLFAGGESTFTLELRLRRAGSDAGSGAGIDAESKDVPCRLLASVVHDADGKPQNMILQLEDLSEQIAAQQEAQQHRERLTHVTRLSTLGEMASGIAHEINQPLTAIVTYAQAARRLQERGAYKDLDSALEKIAQQAERAAAVIKRLRSFVKQQDSEQELLDANALVADVLQFLEMDTGRRDIKIEPRLTTELPAVLADNVQIQQVLLNLLLNAMDATESSQANSNVVVRSYREDQDTVAIEVIDRGCGISEEQQQRLFTPFFTTKTSGMGMGLSICRSIINAHGGQLNYHPNPAGGSVFKFTLPAIIEA
jgi:two-component system sensor kinase FixL